MERLSFYFARFVKNYLHFSAIRDSKVNKKAYICAGAELNSVCVDRYSYVGHNTHINNCDIGAFCSIAGDVVIGGSLHPTEWVSTSPVFHTKRNALNTSFSANKFYKTKKTIIGNDVWIASRVMIKGGVKIGDGAVIGMGSVVTKDIPPYEIWAGNPAKMIKKRFDDETIMRLKNTMWWELSDAELKKIGDLFNDIDLFLQAMKEKDNEQ